MILFSSIASIGAGGFGYRLTAVVATLFCLAGGLVFLRYRENRVLNVIGAVNKYVSANTASTSKDEE